MKLGQPGLFALQIGSSSEKGCLPSFSTPFSRAIIEASHPKKVRMPTIDPFDRTTDLANHLDVYKAHMYVQDIDDATCCRYFLATLKGIAQKWFNGLPDGSIA